MLVQQIAAEANNVNQVLDEWAHTGRLRRQRRRQLLERALDASRRGVEALAQEPLVIDAQTYMADLIRRHDANVSRMQEELRQDAALLKWFLNAECRLLGDLGVSRGAVQRIRDDMLAILTAESLADTMSAQDLQGRLAELLEQLERDVNRLEDEGHHEAIISRVRGVLQALGGGLVIVVDAAAVAGSGPVAVLTAAGSALSIAVGSTAIDGGVKLATSG